LTVCMAHLLPVRAARAFCRTIDLPVEFSIFVVEERLIPERG
jgi:hypothetical protein